MYGKKFVAALLFLVVADVEINAYSHYGGYGGYGGYGDEGDDVDTDTAIPAPSDDLYPTDDGTVVEFPDDMAFYSATFCLHMIDDEDEALIMWAESLPEEDLHFAPTDYVFRADLKHASFD